MAEDIKGLIEKIQQEGIETAGEKARQIEGQAAQRAGGIVKEAEKKALQLIDKAKAEIARMERGANASLKQAGRDLILSLREEINAMLERIVASQVRAALTPEEMSKIIASLIKEMSGRKEGEIVVSLKEKDLKKIEKAVLYKLADEVKKTVSLRPAGEIGAGFIISYDSGKSHFDFTDKAIAGYLSLRLKPELAELLKT